MPYLVDTNVLLRLVQRRDPDQLRPAYHPTVMDQFMRYIKMLVAESMSGRALYAAMGLGCCLYTYTWQQVRDIGFDSWEARTSVRNSERFQKRVEARFPGALAALYSRTPQPHERELIEAALCTFAPWVPDFAPHIALPAGESLVGYCFNSAVKTDSAERLRIHALLDSQCASLAGIIRSYNTLRGHMPLPDPDHKLGFPFVEPLPPSAPARLQPAPMDPDTWAEFRHSLQHQEERRQHFRSGGELIVYFDPTATPWGLILLVKEAEV